MSPLRTVTVTAVLAAYGMAAQAQEDGAAQDILDTNNCAAHIASNDVPDIPSDTFLSSLRYVGCALQTISAGQNMENDYLLQSGNKELHDAVTHLQRTLNFYIASNNAALDEHAREDKLFLSGTLDTPTRASLYEYAIKFGAHDVFTQTAPITEIGDDVSTLFYLRKHLQKLDTDQYIDAMQRAFAQAVQPQFPPFIFEFEIDQDLCDVETPLADPRTPCHEI